MLRIQSVDKPLIKQARKMKVRASAPLQKKRWTDKATWRNSQEVMKTWAASSTQPTELRSSRFHKRVRSTLRTNTDWLLPKTLLQSPDRCRIARRSRARLASARTETTPPPTEPSSAVLNLALLNICRMQTKARSRGQAFTWTERCQKLWWWGARRTPKLNVLIARGSSAGRLPKGTFLCVIKFITSRKRFLEIEKNSFYLSLMKNQPKARAIEPTVWNRKQHTSSKSQIIPIYQRGEITTRASRRTRTFSWTTKVT